MDSTERQNIAAIEALLFQFGDPISIEKIASILNIDKKECDALVDLYEASLKETSRGLILQRDGKTVQLSTKPDFKDIVEKIIHNEFKEDLTPAALETLSIIAYLGPMSRATIDYIRGVNSGFIVRNLLMRGLVERTQSAEGRKTYEYKVTLDFLKHMGLTKIEDLPEFSSFKDILSKYETSSEKEKSPDISEENLQKQNTEL